MKAQLSQALQGFLSIYELKLYRFKNQHHCKSIFFLFAVLNHICKNYNSSASETPDLLNITKGCQKKLLESDATLNI